MLGLSPREVVKTKLGFGLKCQYKDLDGKIKFIHVYDLYKTKKQYEEMLKEGKQGIVVADSALINPFNEMTFSANNLRIKEIKNHEKEI